MQLFNHIPYILYQLLASLALNVLLLLLFRPGSGDATWSIAGICYALFILGNTIFVFYLDTVWLYFFASILVSILYLLIAPFITSTYSKLRHTHGSNESSMIFLIIIYHPFALLGAILLKKLFT